ncbi:hypothetical protein [Methylobacterium trifolii]|uniref:hypothetical protein n=1 Tax=Methylobacterium trifolii TaxID=1003092 RepID=UPI001EE07976|nr:hypothetical protein [Methylobacterium trifolii]
MNAPILHRFRALALGCTLAAGAALPSLAQEMPTIDAARGAFLIHGNFCGPGNRGPGHPPVDALDLACAHHDACSPGVASGRLPQCSCNDRLHEEAGLVARDPRTPRKVRDTAQFIADGALSLPCD